MPLLQHPKTEYLIMNASKMRQKALIGKLVSFVKLKVTQSCLSLCDPIDCSLPWFHGSSVHGILQARILEWVGHSLLQGIFPTQGSNPCLLHCRWSLYHLSHQESPVSLKESLFLLPTTKERAA